LVQRFYVQGSAQPPVKKTAGQIEKETDERRTSNVQHRTSNIDDATLYLILKQANRRISNIEPQNVEGWFRFAQSFFKIDRSTQRLTTGRIHPFDIRPARNALNPV